MAGAGLKMRVEFMTSLKSVFRTDADGNQTSETIHVTVEQDTVNSEPFLKDIPNITIVPGTAVDYQLEAVDIEGDPVFFFAETSPSTGATVSVTETGLVTVNIPENITIPPEQNNGLIATVSVASTDEITLETPVDFQDVKIFVTTGTATAEDDVFTVQEDSIDVVLGVLANDGVSANAMITGLTTSNLLGTATIAANGASVLYTPQADFFGNETFTYIVTTDEGSASVTVTDTVENVDDPPAANNDFYPNDWEADDPQRIALREDAADQFVVASDKRHLAPDAQAPQCAAGPAQVEILSPRAPPVAPPALPEDRAEFVHAAESFAGPPSEAGEDPCAG